MSEFNRKKLLKQSTKENQIFIHIDSITSTRDGATNEIGLLPNSISNGGRLKTLTLEEKTYLIAVRNGNLRKVKRIIENAHKSNKPLDINCLDALGRGAISLAIQSEHIDMVELLLIMGVKPKDALLHAIECEFVEAVELLLEYEELVYVEGEKYSWEMVDWNTAIYTLDITPLILAAHKNNFEILKILLDRGASLPLPHPVGCGCSNCAHERRSDSLRYSMSRVNEYRALISSSLILLTSRDPIRTAFVLSWELRNLAKKETECQREYTELRKSCQQFAVDLLYQIRNSEELDVILSHVCSDDDCEIPDTNQIKLPLLHLAIKFQQKKFIAHPHVQQLLSNIWYDGIPGFRSKSFIGKCYDIFFISVLFPVYCISHILYPESDLGQTIKKPAIKFIVHVTSYLSFLGILILVSQRAEVQLIEILGTERMKENLKKTMQRQRGNGPSYLEWIVLIFVTGYIKQEYLEIRQNGIKSYLRNSLWNIMEFVKNSIYICVVVLKLYAYNREQLEIRVNPESAFIPRERWIMFDPQLIAEGLFATANILSALKLVHMFSVNSHLGPLQVSLGRMFIDIIKFFLIYALVLFSFACGLNQLLWYYAALERKKCYILPEDTPDWNNAADSCSKWRSYGNLFESIQTLFWTGFGEVGLSSFDLSGINSYTRFWALLMFAAFSVLNITVLLNLLIAMMSNSYSIIAEQEDAEWKFARTTLWINYFENKPTLPSPYNLLPTKSTLHSFIYCIKGKSQKNKNKMNSTDPTTCQQRSQKIQFSGVMEALVRRYISKTHNMKDNSIATAEEHTNDLKLEISNLKGQIFQLFEMNGLEMNKENDKDEVLTKKVKAWKRQLMKDRHVGLLTNSNDFQQNRFRNGNFTEDAGKYGSAHETGNYNRTAADNTQTCNLNNVSQIGKCNTKESQQKRSDLQKAMLTCSTTAVAYDK